MKIAFLPPYSPWLMSQELIWSQCKREFKKRILTMKLGFQSYLRREVI